MKLRGIKFGNYHTADEWELILNSKSLTPPTPKEIYVSVNGRDGDLDLSEALTGEVKYENRTASFTFLLTNGSHLDRERIIREILATIHGRKLQIITDDEEEYYLVGRCTVTNTTNNKAYGSVEIKCNCEPWRYSIFNVVRNITVTGETTDIVCVNKGVKTVTPEINVTGSVVIQFNSKSVALSDGTYKITDLLLKTGATKITIQGTGTVTLTYKEAIL